MILSDLKHYIETNGTASRATLAKHFHLSEDGVDAMLSVWINKGQISRLVDTNKMNKVTRVRYSGCPKDTLSMTVTM